MKGREETRDIPVLVLTVIDGRERALRLGADDFGPKPVDRAWLLARLGALAERAALETILIIDDDAVARYVLKGLLILAAGTGLAVVEAGDGGEGLRRAREDRPQAIFLDLVMPDMTGFEVLDRLKADPATAGIPVVVHSSQVLDEEERRRLSAGTAAILSKEGTSRDEALGALREALTKAGLAREGPGKDTPHG